MGAYFVISLIVVVAPVLVIAWRFARISNARGSVKRIVVGAWLGWGVGLYLAYRYFSNNFTPVYWQLAVISSAVLAAVMSFAGGYLAVKIEEQRSRAGAETTEVPLGGIGVGTFLSAYWRAFKYSFVFTLFLMVVSYNLRVDGIFNLIWYMFAVSPFGYLLYVSGALAFPMAIWFARRKDRR